VTIQAILDDALIVAIPFVPSNRLPVPIVIVAGKFPFTPFGKYRSKPSQSSVIVAYKNLRDILFLLSVLISNVATL
jgi:hypothetical protein